MASSINASTTSGIIQTADNSGILQLQSGGTTIATISSTGLQQNVGAPAFSAYQSSSQTVSASTFTKVQFQTKEFDTNSNFDNTTNYRFTPTVAGYYQINGMVIPNGYGQCVVVIYKNGSLYKQGSLGNSASNFTPEANVSSIVFLNGTTDYVELYIILSTSLSLNFGIAYNFFNGAMVRSA